MLILQMKCESYDESCNESSPYNKLKQAIQVPGGPLVDLFEHPLRWIGGSPGQIEWLVR